MISTLTGSSSSQVKNKWSTKEPYVTGYDIVCSKDVYNVAYGKVVFIGHTENNGRNVTVKCNNNEILRYSNLKDVSINEGDTLRVGDRIGTPNRYVHFEYATSWKGDSIFPVRVNEMKYFKQNPEDILEGKYTPTPQVELQFQSGPPTTTGITYSDLQKHEFEGNKWKGR